ncbi:sigma factor binding protein 2, chloroplastic-like isoform X2 [Zingiber officinale]|nr:sigma factor binding protein 2, chloroplastic-like isoform X2 [Zingiber officinale]
MEEESLNQNKKSDPATEKICTKKKKKKNKLQQLIKVVYISNPMKVKATVAEFRSVVQGLTGRDSDLESSLSKYGAVAVDYYGTPDLPPQEEEPCDGSACADLSGDGRAKRAGGELKLDDHEELPGLLSTPPVYYELQE